jgi:ribosome biogenesis protein MAK21
MKKYLQSLKLPFAAHFHPSVSIFASRLLNSSDIPAKPDLASHTLIHFLDRFVYRNAKTITGGLRGSSIMQPAAGSESRDVLISSRLTPGGYESLNSDSFWRKKADDVSVDEVFFHSYFRKMGKGKQAPSKKDKLIKLGLDIRSEDADEYEEEIWQALARSQQEAEGYNTDDGDTDTLEPDDFVNDSPDASDLETGAENSKVASTGGFDDGVLMDWEWKNEYDMKNPSDNGLRKQSIKTSFTQGKESRSKRRKLKNLPTFASIEDYAEILSKDGDEDI